VYKETKIKSDDGEGNNYWEILHQLSIQLRPPSTSSPKVSKFVPKCAAAPMDAPASKMFGYPCKTEKSFMLHVVCRGSMDKP